jgi:hypothetical protein
MTTLASYQPQTTFELERRIVPRDRVSLPDGRVGTVVGFYCHLPVSVLVIFDSGDTAQYAPGDLQRLEC